MLPWKLAPSLSPLGLIRESLEDGDAHDELQTDSLLGNANLSAAYTSLFLTFTCRPSSLTYSKCLVQ